MSCEAVGHQMRCQCAESLVLTSAWGCCRQQAVLDGQDGVQQAALNALGGAVSYLNTALLDRAVLPVARFAALPVAGAAAGRYVATGATAAELAEGPEHMALDGAALQNLEVGIRQRRLGGYVTAACRDAALAVLMSSMR